MKWMNVNVLWNYGVLSSKMILAKNEAMLAAKSGSTLKQAHIKRLLNGIFFQMFIRDLNYHLFELFLYSLL